MHINRISMRDGMADGVINVRWCHPICGFKPEEFVKGEGYYLYYRIYHPLLFDISGNANSTQLGLMCYNKIKQNEKDELFKWVKTRMNVLLRRIHQKNINNALRKRYNHEENLKEWNELTLSFYDFVMELCNKVTILSE